VEQRLVAITGSRGWVGRCLARHAVEHGWRVRGLVRQPSAGGLETGDERQLRLGDDVAPGALEGASALIHCAYDFRPRKWAEIERVNVRGTAKLFAAARAAGVKRSVLISTMSAFEEAKSLYGKAKLEMERIAAAEGALILRPGLVYGDKAGGMYGSLESQVRTSGIIPLIGGGTQVLYLVHETDLSELALRYCGLGFAAPAAPVTAAHSQPWTFRAILEEIAKHAQKRPKFVTVPWRLVWVVLKVAETLRLPLGFRSDSLVSLVNQNPRPDFTQGEAVGFHPRPYATASLLLA
jgi:nucleoside-diphosphate-sugar epimerase